MVGRSMDEQQDRSSRKEIHFLPLPSMPPPPLLPFPSLDLVLFAPPLQCHPDQVSMNMPQWTAMQEPFDMIWTSAFRKLCADRSRVVSLAPTGLSTESPFSI